jgi:hypothetical protein
VDVRKLEKGGAKGYDDGRVRGFLESVWKKPKLSQAEGHCIMNLCMAASYDPDPERRTDSACPSTWRRASGSPSAGRSGASTTR